MMSTAIRWSPRVKKSQIYRLYKSEAMGQLDVVLLDEVGGILYNRCRDILLVADAVAGSVLCPECLASGQTTIIHRPSHDPDKFMTCSQCSWSMTWGEYRRSFQRKQLSLGGAGKAFDAFVKAWPQAFGARQKMLLVDRLIHEFHYSLKDQPTLPTRAACVNLIEGKLADVVPFLDELSQGIDDPELIASYSDWREKRHDPRRPWHHP